MILPVALRPRRRLRADRRATLVEICRIGDVEEEGHALRVEQVVGRRGTGLRDRARLLAAHECEHVVRIVES